MLMNLIPLDADLVKGSHGAIPPDREDHPMLIGGFSDIEDGATIEATGVYDILRSHCVRGIDEGSEEPADSE